ncbi:MAG: PH domain-containing protein [Nocardioidaceae bacterium]|nr:PH domain-containing protein [Nocardioidaceae bacterium]
MAGWLKRTFADPNVASHLLVDEGEIVIDEVRHHWIVYWRAAAELAGSALFFSLFLVSPVDIGWLPLLISAGLCLHSLWLALNEHMDRFVITNMRVFRVRGIFARRLATMPITRILDITVEKPVLGRIFDFGHFVFESAAQEQGLRDIRYVGQPDERDLTIQRVVQRSGLRRSAM